jgi:hypothetical protein
MTGSSIPSNGIKDILVENAIGVFQPNATPGDWVIVISRLRDSPNKMICIYDTPGFAPEPGLDINYPSVQILVRGQPDGYIDGMRKAINIKDVLLGRPTELRGGDLWASFTMSSDIIPLGYDEKERPEFALNFNLIIHQGDLSQSWRQDTGAVP